MKTDPERDLRDMMNRTADGVHHVPRPSHGLVRRARLRRARTALLAGAAVLALVVGGLAGARSLTSDEALPPAEKDSKVSPFVDTWTSTDVDGRTRTMMIRASAAIEDAYEITLHDDPAIVCSETPSTMTGTGRLFDSKFLVIRSPVITCDDGSEPKVADDFPPLEELLVDPNHDFSPFHDGPVFEYDPETDTLTNYSALERLGRRPGGGLMLSGRTLVWGRAE